MPEMSSARRYLITGGTAGIGAMCAEHLTAEGHSVWVTGTREQSVDAAVKSGIAFGGSVCDVADTDVISAAFHDAEHAWGRLDGVFINAGIDGQGLGADRLDVKVFRRVLDINVVGALACAQAAYRHLTRPGAIVFNASVNAIRPERLFADYNASKAAVASLASTLALEWSGEELCVTCVCPGYFRTNMTAGYLGDPVVREELLAAIPMGRFGQPSDIGATVAFLLSCQAPYLSGAMIPVAGARSI